MSSWIGSAISGLLGFAGQERTNQINLKEAARNRRFQERMRNTQYQSAVADMQAAGINPALAIGQGGNAAPSGSMAAPAGDSVGSALQAATQKKQLKLLGEQVRKASAEASSARTQARADQQEYQFRYGTLDWDRDGNPEQLATQLHRLGLLQTEANLTSARQMNRLRELPSGLAGSLSDNFMGLGSSAIRSGAQATQLFKDAGQQLLQRMLNRAGSSPRSRRNRNR